MTLRKEVASLLYRLADRLARGALQCGYYGALSVTDLPVAPTRSFYYEGILASDMQRTIGLMTTRDANGELSLNPVEQISANLVKLSNVQDRNCLGVSSRITVSPSRIVFTKGYDPTSFRNKIVSIDPYVLGDYIYIDVMSKRLHEVLKSGDQPAIDRILQTLYASGEEKR